MLGADHDNLQLPMHWCSVAPRCPECVKHDTDAAVAALWERLRIGGVTRDSSADPDCWDRCTADNCTDVRGLTEKAARGAVHMASTARSGDGSPCIVTITGGTEAGHTANSPHWDGKKLDFSYLYPCLNSWIRNTTRAHHCVRDVRHPDSWGSETWDCPNGDGRWTLEVNHWDVRWPNDRCWDCGQCRNCYHLTPRTSELRMAACWSWSNISSWFMAVLCFHELRNSQ